MENECCLRHFCWHYFNLECGGRVEWGGAHTKTVKKETVLILLNFVLWDPQINIDIFLENSVNSNLPANYNIHFNTITKIFLGDRKTDN